MNKVKLEKFNKDDAKFIRDNFPTYFMDNSIDNIERVIESWNQKFGFLYNIRKSEGWDYCINRKTR